MKKIITLVLIATMILGLCACGAKAPAASPAPVPTPAPAPTESAAPSEKPVESQKPVETKPAEPEPEETPEPAPVPTPVPTPEPAPEVTPDAPSVAPELSTDALAAVLDAILSGLELPAYSYMELLDDEMFSFFTFIDRPEGAVAMTADAAIGSIAHSVVVVKVPEGVDAATVAADIEANADPRKWICVEAEKVIVSYHEDTILLVMSAEATADAIAANFDALYK